jgi:asparagine synthase (glutamine-hydrolysing)
LCGIAGVFSFGYQAEKIDIRELQRMRGAMLSRGPDNSGQWIHQNQKLGLAHQRLSIVDLSSAGDQPMLSKEHGLVIVFNGEIYNHVELRLELLKKGYQFHSKSDTEVIVAMYSEYGSDCVNHLQGMFAFAIWDEKKQGVFLARDQFGIKPLYYSVGSGVLRFASQVKALLATNAINKTPDSAGYVGYLLLGSVPEPFTLYQNIHALKAGSRLWISNNCIGQESQYWSVSKFLESAEKESLIPSVGLFESALNESMIKHLSADVPVGLFLSSGMDSSALAISASSISENIKALTLGFEDYKNTSDDEIPSAVLTAEHLGISHIKFYANRKNFLKYKDKFFDAMDQPSVDGLNIFFISKLLKEQGLKVGITGLGGDEWFAGYPSFSHVPALASLPTIERAGKWFRRIGQKTISKVASEKYAGIFEYCGNYSGAYLLRRSVNMPWRLPEILTEDFAVEGWRRLELFDRLDATTKNLQSPRLKVTSLEIEWYMRNQLLRDADWAGMANSVEIRTPFIDLKFANSILPIINSANRISKKTVFSEFLIQNFPGLLRRKKTGFSVPIKKWLMSDKGDDKFMYGSSSWQTIILNKFVDGNYEILKK